VAAVSYEVTLLNADAPIVLSSEPVYQEETRPAESDQRGSGAIVTVNWTASLSRR
jgi:hypothetical protein